MYTLKLPKVIGHRGASGYAPENTLISMYKAWELGVKWVEFDVMLTKDHIPIIIHDERLDRTTSGSGEVAATTWADIENLEAGSWFDKTHNNERVPSFEQLLKFLTKLNLNINIEIKPTVGKEKITAEKILEVLYKHWPINQSIPLLSSANAQSLETIYDLDQTLPLGLISDIWIPDWKIILQQLHCISFNVNHEVLTPDKVQEIKNFNYAILSYTVNDPMRAKELFSWGVDTVFSDFPDEILK